MYYKTKFWAKEAYHIRLILGKIHQKHSEEFTRIKETSEPDDVRPSTSFHHNPGFVPLQDLYWHQLQFVESATTCGKVG